MCNTTTFVLSTGPPLVIKKAGVKVWNDQIICSIMTNKMTGDIIGSVTWRNFAQIPAPSISCLQTW